MKIIDKKKALLFLSVLAIILIFSSGTNYPQTLKKNSNFQNHERDKILEKVPKVSADELNITTPENKTYYAPMGGYYPGTYGFENDEDGSFPIGWVEGGTTTGKTAIIDSKEDHNKVMLINDNDGNRITPRQDFTTEQSSGTVEFWVYFGPSNLQNSTGIRLENSTGAILVSVYADGTTNDEWVYQNGTNLVFTGLSAINEWFHLSIDFSSSGNYKGLSDRTYKFTIRRTNGSIFYESQEVNYATYNIGNAATLSITSWQNTIRDTWIDAVGYSWDPNYNIRDNFYEGLLLSFENSTTLDWKGYSLDNHANKTILGNATIQMPEFGYHTIQLFANNSVGSNFESELRGFTIDYTPIPFIHIKNDNWSATDLPYVQNRTGNWGDPHIIENLIITGQKSRICIYIEDSNDYFIIRKCTVYNSGGFEPAGIKLKNTHNGTLTENTCMYHSNYGINLYNCNNITILNNTVNYNRIGILLENSDNNKVLNNSASHNLGVSPGGIWLSNSNDNEIFNNTVNYNQWHGILIFTSNYNRITNNTLSFNVETGIYILGVNNGTISYNVLNNNFEGGMNIWSCANLTLFENKFKYCGIKIQGTIQELNSIKINISNTVNDNPVYYSTNEIGLQPNDFSNPGQIILVNSTDSIISNFNISYGSIAITLIYCINTTISNNNLSFNTNDGIILRFCNNSVVSGNILNYCESGIDVEDCINNTISGNTLGHHEEYAIDVHWSSVENSNYTIIFGNIMRRCGLNLQGSLKVFSSINIDKSNLVNQKTLYYYYNKLALKSENFSTPGQIILVNCNNSLIADFNISHTSSGIIMHYCRNNTVSNNILSNNTLYGIRINYSWNITIADNFANNNGYCGVYLYNSSESSVSKNLVENNNEMGIECSWNCRNNTIFENIIKKNKRYGIYSSLCDKNLFYFNSFIENSLHVWDSHLGIGNYWNNSLIGNYWDNYTEVSGGIDANNDGIGDVPYNFNYGSDNRPIFESPIHDGTPIHIDDNNVNDHDWAWTALMKYWCMGSGASNDPYVIENLIINGNNLSSGIFIENSNVHFNIRSSSIYNSSAGDFSTPEAGIKLKNTYNGVIVDCNVSYNIGAGIYLENCHYNNISHNTVNSNGDYRFTLFGQSGIVLTESNNNYISNNNLNNNFVGISFGEADHNYILNNTLSYNEVGISLIGPYGVISYNNISGNTIKECDSYGIQILGNLLTFNVKYNNFSKNLMIGCGVYLQGTIDELKNQIINKSNTVNGRPVYYYVDQNGLNSDDFNSAGQVILINCNYSTISNLNLSRGSVGITLYYCNNITASNNIIFDSKEYGVYSDYGSDNKFLNNTISSASGGLRVSRGINNNITENKIYGDLEKSHNDGIYLFACNYSILKNNSMYQTGLRISGYDNYEEYASQNIDTTNEVNEKPLYYYVGINGLDSDDFINSGQIILINCNYSYITWINISHTNYGITLRYCHNSIIKYCITSNNSESGIYLTDGYSNVISGCIANYNGDEGLFIRENDNGIIRNNTVNYNVECGINFDWSFNITVINNTVNFNDEYGMLSEFCYNSSIKRNIICYNGLSGLKIMTTGNITVSENIIKENGEYGFDFYNSNNNTIKRNIISNNIIRGINIDSYSESNLIFNNSFIDNGLQAFDDGINNQWSEDSLGNYWSDYPSDDQNDDGIGDTLYLILGSAGSADYYPIWNDGFNGSAIFIDDTAWNSWDWAITRIWCSGSGTSEDPYVIKDLIINGTNSGSCISIANSNVYFRIENCTFFSCGNNQEDAGIKLFKVTNGNIIDNNCSFNPRYGIFLDSSNYTFITGNTANYNENYGIWLKNSNNNTVSGNTVHNNSQYGIILLVGNENNITGNKVTNHTSYGLNSFGIVLNSCNNNNISANIAIYNSIAISLFNCESNTILENSVLNNTYYGLILNITTGNCIENEILFNNVSYNGIDGILLHHSNNNTISYNTVNFNVRNGITLIDSHYNNITNNVNTLSNNGNCGICLNSSNFAIISGNSINYNPIGIYLYSSNFTTISNNNLVGNTEFWLQDNCVGNTFVGNYLGPTTVPTVGGGNGGNGGQEPGVDMIMIIAIIAIGIVVSISAGRYYKIKKDKMQKLPGKLPRKKERILGTPEEITPSEEMEVERKIKRPPIPKTEEIAKKKKKAKLPIPLVDVAETEKKDLEKTESELDIEKQKFVCIVHKGAVKGANIYLCPQCETIYCTKCVKALKKKGETCWVCEYEFEI